MLEHEKMKRVDMKWYETALGLSVLLGGSVAIIAAGVYLGFLVG